MSTKLCVKATGTHFEHTVKAQTVNNHCLLDAIDEFNFAAQRRE